MPSTIAAVRLIFLQPFHDCRVLVTQITAASYFFNQSECVNCLVSVISDNAISSSRNGPRPDECV